MYVESDHADAVDLYGRTKLLGEVDEPGCVTIRTSIIGPELGSANGLVEWFLSQTGRVKGYSRAVFSGLPTVELARVVRDHVLPRPHLRGLWHVSAEPITKLELLCLVRDAWGRDIAIEPDDRLVIDRSLCSERFRRETGYQPPSWPDLVKSMREFG
jgi:dTDP-4-dehydrorhamnose reductase